MSDHKNEIGRPTKYDPKYCDDIINFMSEGKSLVAYAGKLRVAVSSLYEWEKKHPDFSEAIKVARHLCQSWWEDQCRDGLFMGERQTFSQSAWIFNMKARFGYRDKIDIDVNNKVQPAFDTSKMTKEEYFTFLERMNNKENEEG